MHETGGGRMPAQRAIDVVIFPFTPDTKTATYEHVPVLKNSMVHLEIWDKEFSAKQLVELDVPAQIQVGMAFQAGLRNVGHPSTIDTIAVDFPDLRLVAIHTGYPWEREMVSVAWKHPNVFIGADLHHPRTWSKELVGFI